MESGCIHGLLGIVLVTVSSGASIKNKGLLGTGTPSCSKRERRMFSASQDVYENYQLYEDPSPLEVHAYMYTYKY